MRRRTRRLPTTTTTLRTQSEGLELALCMFAFFYWIGVSVGMLSNAMRSQLYMARWYKPVQCSSFEMKRFLPIAAKVFLFRNILSSQSSENREYKSHDREGYLLLNKLLTKKYYIVTKLLHSDYINCMYNYFCQRKYVLVIY